MNVDKFRKFQSGDVVQLKSGGPNMTVEYYVQDQVVSGGFRKTGYLCTWFNKTNDYDFNEVSNVFAENALVKMDYDAEKNRYIFDN